MILCESPKIELICADCMDILPTFKAKQWELACVDPPYGIGMDNSNKRTKPSRPNSYIHYPDFRYHKTDWDDNRPDKLFFDNLFRTTENQLIFGANYFCSYLPCGFGWIFWNKMNGLNNCFSDGEFIFSSKGVKSAYIELSQFHSLSGGKDRIHPTEKPTLLYRWLYQNYAKAGDKILDTHLGSGSSAIAAYREGFEFFGIEKDEEYFNAAVERFKRETAQADLFKPIQKVEQLKLIE